MGAENNECTSGNRAPAKTSQTVFRWLLTFKIDCILHKTVENYKRMKIGPLWGVEFRKPVWDFQQKRFKMLRFEKPLFGCLATASGYC